MDNNDDDDEENLERDKNKSSMIFEELSEADFIDNLEGFDRNSEYQIRPTLSDKFKSLSVKELIHTVLHEELGGKVYSMDKSEEWTKTIVTNVKDSVKGLGFKRYKIIVQTILGQNKGSGVKIGARCLWDADTDNFASDSFLNDTMFCCVTVFGIYCY